MKYLYAALAMVLAVANAQLPNVPSCSLTCFTSALTSDGCATLVDFKCHCSKPQLVSQINPCVQAACSASDAATVAQVVEKTCSDAGVPIVVPQPGGGSSSAASSPAAASSSPAAVQSSTMPASSSAVGSSTKAAPSSPATQSASSSPAATATSAGFTTKGPSIPTTMATTSGGYAQPTGGPGNGTNPGMSPSTTVTPFTGGAAANHNTHLIGVGLVAVLLAALHAI